MLNQNFVILGTLISTIGSLAYLIDTIQGNVKPNKVSFLLWSIAPFIAFFAQIKQGVGLEVLMTFSTGFFPLVIFLASFLNKKAFWNITSFDITCGALSVLGLFFWYVTGSGNIAITFSILADGLAALPTVKKAYFNPESEIAWPWIATSVGVALTLLTLDKLTYANSAFIIYIFIVNTIIFSFVQLKIGKKR